LRNADALAVPAPFRRCGLLVVAVWWTPLAIAAGSVLALSALLLWLNLIAATRRYLRHGGRWSGPDPRCPAFDQGQDDGIGLLHQIEAVVREYPAESQALHGGDQNAGILLGNDVRPDFPRSCAAPIRPAMNCRKNCTSSFIRSRNIGSPLCSSSENSRRECPLLLDEIEMERMTAFSRSSGVSCARPSPAISFCNRS